MAIARPSVQSGFSRVAEALSDPAREAMVSALADGKAMPAGELAAIAGVSPQGASAHLQKLVDANVLSVWAQGRFRYYRISGEDVATFIYQPAHDCAPDHSTISCDANSLTGQLEGHFQTPIRVAPAARWHAEHTIEPLTSVLRRYGYEGNIQAT